MATEIRQRASAALALTAHDAAAKTGQTDLRSIQSALELACLTDTAVSDTATNSLTRILTQSPGHVGVTYGRRFLPDQTFALLRARQILIGGCS
jgi:tRNA A37 N6-isopentenylltransferase MiaA